jgi:hypothetical protein
MYVAGRQFSVQGDYRPILRHTHDYSLSFSAVSTGWTPVFSFRRKSGFHNTSVRPGGYQVVSTTNDVLVAIHTGMTLGGSPSWGVLTETAAADTVLEKDTAGTITADLSSGAGIRRQLSYTTSGQPNRAQEADFLNDLAFGFEGDDAITYIVKGVGGTATVDLIVTLIEEW